LTKAEYTKIEKQLQVDINEIRLEEGKRPLRGCSQTPSINKF